MNNELIQILDKTSRLSLTLSDCTAAAAELARAHLSGPTASTYLAQALAGVAILGTETTQDEETVTFRLDCNGAPLGGFLVEMTEKGTLRGYTKVKILNDFDGEGRAKDASILGETGTFEVLRSVPGRILGSGSVAVKYEGKPADSSVAQGLETYYNTSLQRRTRVAIIGAAGEDGVPTIARAALLECAPDGDVAVFEEVAKAFGSGEAAKALATPAASVRTILKKLGLPQAEIRETKPLLFACRCSRERAEAMIASLPDEDRKALAVERTSVDITCHMCGRTWTVSTGG